MHLAAEQGDEKLIDLLITNNANVNDIDREGNFIFHGAVVWVNVGIAEKLIKAGASMEKKNDEGQTVLHLTAKWNRKLILDLLK